jgi:hypothetical protein
MSLDLRVPIGLLFVTLGGLLTIYGLATQFTDPAMYERSLGININLWWGLVMLAFGGGMMFFGRRNTVMAPGETTSKPGANGPLE